MQRSASSLAFSVYNLQVTPVHMDKFMTFAHGETHSY